MNIFVPYIIGGIVTALCFYFKYIPPHLTIVISCLSILSTIITLAMIYCCYCFVNKNLSESKTKLLTTVFTDKIGQQKLQHLAVITCLTIAGLVLSTIVSDFNWYAFVFMSVTQLCTLLTFNKYTNDEYETLINNYIEEDRKR